MSIQKNEFEKILGGEIELRDQRSIPGVMPIDGTEFMYFEDDGKSKPKKQFNLLLDAAGKIVAASGGIISDGCRITLPGGTVFHALSYHGDIAGWRAVLQAGANARGLLLARVEGGSLLSRMPAHFHFRIAK